MSDNTYKCDVCGETYEKGLTDAEAAKQFESEFPGFEPDDCGVVCDDCFKCWSPIGEHP